MCIKGETQTQLFDHFSNFTDNFNEVPFLLLCLWLLPCPGGPLLLVLPPEAQPDFKAPLTPLHPRGGCTSALRYLVAYCDV